MEKNKKSQKSYNAQGGIKRTQTVHPYTFIPLKAGRKRTKNEKAELLTGNIVCELKAMTPVAVPDSQEEDGSYPFYRVGGRLIVPGSAIRGVVRSTYEALTDSCMRTTDEHFHRRSAEPKKPGLLVREGDAYRLYEAERFRVDDKCDTEALKTGDEVNFSQRASKNNSPRWACIEDDGAEKGVFLGANRFPGRDRETGERTLSHQSVFLQLKTAPFDVDGIYIQCLKENIALYDLEQTADGKGVQKKAGKQYTAAFEKMEKGGYALPVWYEQDEDEFRFAPSQISRDVYPIGPKDFLTRKGLAPCTSRTSLCPACSLFGFAGEDQSKAGRIRFSDAVCIGEERTRLIELPALMGPKMSSFEFYLRNDASTHLFTPEDTDTELSGRKMYWHSQNGTAGTRFLESSDKFKPSVEAVEEKTTFGFNVYFDGITKDELNELVYAFNLGEIWSGDGRYCLKLGHGKPAGLGSVHIEVKSVRLRTFTAGKYVVDDNWSWKEPLKKVEDKLSNIDVLKRVLAFDTIPADKVIAYPNIDGDGLKWYGANHIIGKPYIEVLEIDGRYGYRIEDKKKPRTQTFGDSKAKGEIDSRWAALKNLK